ncbi:DUF2264 domain-containing protein [Streptomyces sp. NPDC051554]|uniref:DUF2264 domain-containing protein n=1 Tax=Streptomyces sp. NPDC051554 TaxID=3365656 RepID=UPI0037964606
MQPTRHPPFLPLPVQDHGLSPVTGWTRAHWEAMADHLLDAVVPYATPGFGQVRLPGRASRSGTASDGLEGFARSLLLAAFRIAGSRGSGCDALIERYARGLAEGTAPGSPLAWPAITDYSQQMVEAASVAVALHESRPWLWNRLDPVLQGRVRDWLGGVLGRRVGPNNWLLFPTVIQQFLATVDGPHNRQEIERGLDAIEEWYVGDGWYSDGTGRSLDYYNAWALHLYPLLWTRMAGTAADDRGGTYRERLKAFLEGYAHFFGADGAPVHMGRSLTYRFAALAPLWLGRLCESTPLSPGATRRLASGVLRHFAEHGVPDRRGLLTLGWHAPHLPTTQPYSGPASPYWASKGFLGLLLPPDDAVWTDTEELAPNDLADHVIALPGPGFLLHSTCHDGVVRLLNHGSDRSPPPPAPASGDDPHYAKLAYSSRTAPETSQRAGRDPLDNHVTLLTGEDASTRRRRVEPIAVDKGFACSRYSAGANSIETVALVRGPWEVRIHTARAPQGVALRDGGYAVAHTAKPATTRTSRWALAALDDGLTSAAIALYGYDDAAVRLDAQANAFGPQSATPYLLSGRSDTQTIHVSLMVLSADSVNPEALLDAFTVRVADHVVSVSFPDGGTARVALSTRETVPTVTLAQSQARIPLTTFQNSKREPETTA